MTHLIKSVEAPEKTMKDFNQIPTPHSKRGIELRKWMGDNS